MMADFNHNDEPNIKVDEYVDIKIYLENKKHKAINWKKIMIIIVASLIIVSFITLMLYNIFYYNMLLKIRNTAFYI